MSTNENKRRETIFHSVLCVSIEQCSMIDVRKLKYLKQLTCNLSSFSVSPFSSKIRYHFPLLLMLNLLLLSSEGTVASREMQSKRTLSFKIIQSKNVFSIHLFFCLGKSSLTISPKTTLPNLIAFYIEMYFLKNYLTEVTSSKFY